MKKLIFSIYDVKGKFYSTPFYVINKPTAVRTFTDAVHDEQTLICKHPEDYSLYYLGEFEDEFCTFNLENAPELVHTALQLVNINRREGEHNVKKSYDPSILKSP